MKKSHEQFILIYNAFNSIRIHQLIFCPKDQLISKGLFGTLKFLQKTNQQIRF